MFNEFTGQWRGHSSSGAHCIVNIDERKGGFEGRVSSFITFESSAYWTGANLAGHKDSDLRLVGRIQPGVIHSRSGEILGSDEYKTLIAKIPNFEHELFTDYFVEKIAENTMSGRWISEFPSGSRTEGTIELTRKPKSGSMIPHQEMSWGDFKRHALIQDDSLIYRGQPSAGGFRQLFTGPEERT